MKLFKKKNPSLKSEDEEVMVPSIEVEVSNPEGDKEVQPNLPEGEDYTELEDVISVTDDDDEIEEEMGPSDEYLDDEEDEHEPEEEIETHEEPEPVQFTREEITILKEILPKIVALLSGEAEIEIIEEAPEEPPVTETVEENSEEEEVEVSEEEVEAEDSDTTKSQMSSRFGKQKTVDFNPFVQKPNPGKVDNLTGTDKKTKPFGSRWTQK